jgi:hypothetical protein
MYLSLSGMLPRIIDRVGFSWRRLLETFERIALLDHRAAGWAQGGKKARGRVPERGVSSRSGAM